MKKVSLAFAILLLTALPLTFNACDKGTLQRINNVFGDDNVIQSTGGGNPMTNDDSSAGNVSNPIFSEMAISLSPFQPLSIDSLTICISRLRFRSADDSSSSSDVRFELGDVLISASGTKLAGVNLPDGTYDEIEMELDDSCPSKMSVQLLRAGKLYSTNRFIELSFTGHFTAQQAKMKLTLGLQEIINNLNSITSADDIEAAFESGMERYAID